MYLYMYIYGARNIYTPTTGGGDELEILRGEGLESQFTFQMPFNSTRI